MDVKELIPLRFRTLKDGRQSIYLDLYRDGRRTYEYLRLYLLPGNDPVTKARNRETLKVAKTIQAERISAIQKGEAHILERKKAEVFFDEYVKSYASSARFSKRYAENLGDCLAVWKRCFKKRYVLSEIDRLVLLEFIEYLRTATYGKKNPRPYSPTSSRRYIQNLNAIFKCAMRDELIKGNPMDKILPAEKISGKPAERCYLTLDEVRMMAETPCGNHMIKHAFLFSCFTGLRLSDLRGITWDMIQDDHINMIQQKTKNRVIVPLSENAKEWLPEREGDHLFYLPDRFPIGVTIRRWAERAGVKKHVTMHVARHTFATLALTYGADLYTVSKLLGHTNIATTQIYAKVVDEKKVTAVNLIPKL